jgi:hypothetical protein
MEPRLAMTVTGIDDDGKKYTIRGYKRMIQREGHWVEEPLISIAVTDEGQEVHCESEDPLVFWIPGTGVKIRCQPEKK